MQNLFETRIADMQQRYHAGSFADAATSGWELLRTNPTHAVLLNLLALAEHRLGNHEAAIVLLQRAIKANPGGAAHWNDLGNVYCARGSLKDAEHAYQSAVICDPQCAEAFNNLGVMAGDRENFEEARAYYEQALRLRPAYADAVYNIGIALAALGKYQKALRRYEHAMVLRPEHKSTRFNIALTRLLLGDYAGAWKEWESRWHSPQLASSVRNFSQPQWKGESIADKRILLYAEQGIGDTLQFLRYLPMVKARGASIVLEVQKPLVPLLERQSMRIDAMYIVARGEGLPPFDVYCPLMSLPAIFGTTLANIPQAAGYFPALGHSSREEKTGLRVGLVWAGSPTHKRDRARSIALAKLKPLFDVPGVQWFSLQKGAAAEQLVEFPERVAIHDLAAGFKDYADTATAIAGLDLVITVDTSVAHLAGTMGKPVWILLHEQPDWRWLLKRRDSPWYTSARLFRQASGGDWSSVIAAVVRELQVYLPAPAK
jgi:tetratricopeptide (TPR) repeat protein